MSRKVKIFKNPNSTYVRISEKQFEGGAVFEISTPIGSQVK